MIVAAVKRLFSWGPLLALVGIEYPSIVMIYCLTVFWPPFHSLTGFLNILVIAILQVFGIYNFLCAALIGPGYLPLNWKPENSKNEKFLSYCKICKGFKAPRAHHCQRCKRCVMKMDHHCPWINNCCGHRNHAYLTWFCLFAICGQIQCFIIVSYSAYKLFKSILNPLDLPYLFYFCFSVMSISLSTVFSISILFIVNMRSILQNQTRFERWIVSKVRSRGKGENFIYPYDIGYIKNLKMVFCSERKYEDPNDGIRWKVKEGCNQYTLTIEGIRQSDERRRKSKTYAIVEKFDGSFFPTTLGYGVMCTSVLLVDKRIQVNVRDKILVSCSKRYWLFGEVQDPSSSSGDVQPIKGWFPRSCAVEIINGADESHLEQQESLSKKKD